MATILERIQKTGFWTKTIVGVAATIVTLSGALSVIGIDFPRPVWASELEELENRFLQLDSSVTGQQLSDTSLRLYQNLREQNSYKREQLDIPDYLLQEQTDLEIKKRILEQKLDQIQKDSQ